MADAPEVLFDSFGGSTYTESWRFNGYAGTICATQPDEVLAALKQLEQASAAGLYAAGFVAYEAASALNQALPALAHHDGVPLVWFALFRERTEAASADVEQNRCGAVGALEPLCTGEEYERDVESIRSYIAAGDCYQVNHTFPLLGTLPGTARELYDRVAASQQAAFCAYIDTGRYAVVSASPELFFAVQGDRIVTRPMKGTARRSGCAESDQGNVERLRSSAKERAENLMIVDLLRNDLATIAETGSVTVDALFEVETYPTVHQMTSTISAQLKAGTGLTDIFQAMFPCGSVTGAPKRRSMEIIAEVESRPRGIYCGAIGCVAPGGDMVFSVAIRTLLHDRHTGQMTMGVGSAITWDAAAATEYAECLDKAAFVRRPVASFRLIESVRLDHGDYTLLQEHLDRLEASARYFSFACDRAAIEAALRKYVVSLTGVHKVRLLLACDGSYEVSAEPLADSTAVLQVAVTGIGAVNSADVLRRHKTTLREVFEQERATRPECDEVLLLNERGELTEGSYHTLVVRLNGRNITPPLSSGVLPGILRQQLVADGTLVEGVLSPENLDQAEAVWLINSVRGWRSAVVVA